MTPPVPTGYAAPFHDKGNAMQRTREQLIDHLVADAPPVTVLLPARLRILAWVLPALLAVGLLLALTAPYRPGAFSDLLSQPRYLLETALSLASLWLLGLYVLRQGIPGETTAFWPGLLAGLTWLGLLLYGLRDPALDTGTLGERPHCMVEVILYGLPVLLAGFWLLRRAFVMQRYRTGLAAGLVSGLVPAILMQFACMYDPAHALQAHIAPALLVGVAGGLLGSLTRQPARG